MICPRCDTISHQVRFCSACGKLLDRDSLRQLRLLGPVGIAHTTSSTVEEFFATGDPDVFTRH
jgi:hypothetical protein